ncbi:MAG: helix-turn-helix transcriptional regulator [Idiomarina sp.]|nr:helix-turn-helix transcriptional regulator [Idiomarina sp.]
MLINAAFVRTERLAKGWTQQQLADVTGLSLRTIQRVESQGLGSMETINALCSVFEQPITSIRVESSENAQQGLPSQVRYLIAGSVAGFLVGVVMTLLLS